ncbi:GNAT family N-acetyltransferase [Ferruginibacter lapsinanis]|uniref:GNAT family N-acetyltransferase n=1 Tax=Ferruginibacter lapsinanis TaxID=563172 RepID=UPI001E50B8F8|nr:GNAT family N-acetyltransferase [Ferruginibacter lapsinanis]UEG50358.1 GNAT family N-acetyltransferase [Ferruginibacter lapsinanis]
MGKIRQAIVADVNELSVLFDNYRIFYEKESDIDGAKQFLQQRIQNKESVIFIYFTEENKMAGFVQLYPLFSSTRMKKLWLLNDLFVQPNHRGQGVSIALIEEAKKLCLQTNACGLSLETAKTNSIGNKLYPKTGFSLDQDHNYYYWDVPK